MKTVGSTKPAKEKQETAKEEKQKTNKKKEQTGE